MAHAMGKGDKIIPVNFFPLLKRLLASFDGVLPIVHRSIETNLRQPVFRLRLPIEGSIRQQLFSLISSIAARQDEA